MAKYAQPKEDAGPDGAVLWTLSGVRAFTPPPSFSAVCEALEPWERPSFIRRFGELHSRQHPLREVLGRLYAVSREANPMSPETYRPLCQLINAHQAWLRQGSCAVSETRDWAIRAESDSRGAGHESFAAQIREAMPLPES